MQDLSNYSLDVIRPVLDRFGKEEPEDFKAVWPAVGVFIGMMRGQIRANREPEPDAAERLRIYTERAKAEGLEAPDADMLKRIEDLNSRFGLKKEKVIETGFTELACMKCGTPFSVAGNIRLWTAKEIREHADVVEQCELIAERNREVKA